SSRAPHLRFARSAPRDTATSAPRRTGASRGPRTRAPDPASEPADGAENISNIGRKGPGSVRSVTAIGRKIYPHVEVAFKRSIRDLAVLGARCARRLSRANPARESYPRAADRARADPGRRRGGRQARQEALAGHRGRADQPDGGDAGRHRARAEGHALRSVRGRLRTMRATPEKNRSPPGHRYRASMISGR